MHILSIINFPYFRPGGGLVTMHALYHQLAARGHAVTAIHTFSVYSPVVGKDADNRESALSFLEKNGIIKPGEDPGETLRFADGKVDVHYVASGETLGAYLDQMRGELADVDWVMLATHESDAMGEAVFAHFPAEKVLFTCHASEGLPFGPRAMNRGARTLEHLKKCRAIWVPSEYVQRYLKQHAGLDTTVLRTNVYGPPPWKDLSAWDHGHVTLINNSLPKGLPIMTGLAQEFPDVPFATVPSWEMGGGVNTSSAGYPPNVTLLSPVAHSEIDSLYAQIRILLAPSLLHEAFGLVVVEAMLRGIPVLAADVGGLPEAKLGVPYLLPLASISWNAETKTWVQPTYELGPWRDALRALLTDRELYADISRRSRAAAAAFVASLPKTGLEDFVRTLG